MYLWLTLVSVVFLSKSNAQLTSPREAVCCGTPISLICHQQTGTNPIWTVHLSSSREIFTIVRTREVGSTLTFQRDPRFQIHINSITSNNITTELRVKVVRGLNNVSVECAGGSGTFTSVIQVASVDLPPAPSGITTFFVNHTKTGASATVTWSHSNGADDYTISIKSLSTMPGQMLSNFTTTDTIVQLAVEYNVEYAVTITAQNCAGSISTNESVVLAGCSPPSPLTNGRINEYLSGSVGSLLTYQCNTGYLPHGQMTSTCMADGSWVPTPHCVLAVTNCSSPSVPPNAHIIGPSYNMYIKGTDITFQCDNQSQINFTTMCQANGDWSPSPSELDCNLPAIETQSDGSAVGLSLSVIAAISSSCILFLLLILIVTIVLAIVIMHKRQGGVKSKPVRDSSQDLGGEYAETRHPGPRGGHDQHQDIGGEYAETFHLGPRGGHVQQQESGEEYAQTSHLGPRGGRGKKKVRHGDSTLIYADLGPRFSKKKPSKRTSAPVSDDRVIYSELNRDFLERPAILIPPCNEEKQCVIDSIMNLNTLLIQLRGKVTPKWQEFARVVGLENMIQGLMRYTPDECLVEIVDQWLKSHPTLPTWRDVSNVVKQIGLPKLSEDLLMAYQTGELPVNIDPHPNGILSDEAPQHVIDEETQPPPVTTLTASNIPLSIPPHYEVAPSLLLQARKEIAPLVTPPKDEEEYPPVPPHSDDTPPPIPPQRDDTPPPVPPHIAAEGPPPIPPHPDEERPPPVPPHIHDEGPPPVPKRTPGTYYEDASSLPPSAHQEIASLKTPPKVPARPPK